MTLLERYSQLQRAVAFSAEKVGRDPSSIKIVAVTKQATLSQMQRAYDLGLRDFAESRLEPALEKILQMPSDVCWHFIGQIQSKKAAKIIQAFDYIHSVASLKTLELLRVLQQKLGNLPSLFLQVNVSKEASKQGFRQEELASCFSSYSDLPLVGLMTMAPLTEDQERIRFCFHRLAQLKNRVHLPHLSMGMSQDFQIAVEEGSTFLRIGSYLFE